MSFAHYVLALDSTQYTMQGWEKITNTKYLFLEKTPAEIFALCGGHSSTNQLQNSDNHVNYSVGDIFAQTKQCNMDNNLILVHTFIANCDYSR